MSRLTYQLIIFTVGALLASPQVYACMGPGLEFTLFFNANAQGFFIEKLAQKPSKTEELLELPPDADVLAEVVLTGADSAQFDIPTAANIVRVIKTSDDRVRRGKKIPIKFEFSSCGPNNRSGSQGTIMAKIGTDIDGGLVLCPYSRRFSDGLIHSPVGSTISECNPSEIEAARQIKRAAEKGESKAQTALALMYEKGKNVRWDNAEAMKWFQRAANSGDAEAQYELAAKYARDKNGTEALKYYELAARQGEAQAMNEFGRIYEYGWWGVKQSEAEALKWYTFAVENGNNEAKRARDELKKMEILKLAVERGDAEVQYELGKMYYHRRKGIEALKWYKLAAAQGLSKAMNELGYLYQVGAAGVTEDLAEAIKWYRIGAEQGDADSQCALGQMYRVYDKEFCGKQTYECLKNAVAWYRRAAEQGHSRAQYFLGRMYHDGKGVEQSQAEAVKWYNLAADQGDYFAKEFLEQMKQQGH